MNKISSNIWKVINSNFGYEDLIKLSFICKKLSTNLDIMSILTSKALCFGTNSKFVLSVKSNNLLIYFLDGKSSLEIPLFSTWCSFIQMKTKVFFCGGWKIGHPIKDSVKVRILKKETVRCSNMLFPVYFHTLVNLQDRKYIYSLGGRGLDAEVNKCSKYSQKEKIWKAAPPLSEKKRHISD